MNNSTHYLKVDYRVVSLDMIINGLNEAITALKNQSDEIEWHDGVWLMEECEPIYGLAFIALQNYINGSIKDFKGDLTAKHTLYRLEQDLDNYSKSRIELIIGLANYSKHKDEGTLHKGTKEILDCFELNYEDVLYLEKSPIFQGLTILDKDWNLLKIKDLVTKWREILWSKLIKIASID